MTPSLSRARLDAGRYLLWAVPFILFTAAAVAMISGLHALAAVLALAGPVLMVPGPRFGVLWWVVVSPYLRRAFQVSGVSMYDRRDIRALYFSPASPLRPLLGWAVFAWTLSVGMAWAVLVVLPRAL